MNCKDEHWRNVYKLEKNEFDGMYCCGRKCRWLFVCMVKFMKVPVQKGIVKYSVSPICDVILKQKNIFVGSKAYSWIRHDWISTCTVSNKNTYLPVFEICVFRVYLLNNLSLKKVIYIYLYPCLKSFQMKKIFFEIRSQSQLIFWKTLFCQKKSAILKKTKTFFHVYKVKE